MTKMSEVFKSLYAEDRALLIALTDKIREQLQESLNLTCYPPETNYSYTDWSDENSDNPYEGPCGMTYGFYIQMQNFYVWFGFSFFTHNATVDYQTFPDTLLLELSETPHLPSHSSQRQPRQNTGFDPQVRTILESFGFHRHRVLIEWLKYYKIPASPNTETLITEIVTDIKKLANTLNLTWKPPEKFIAQKARELFFLAQSDYDKNLHYDAEAIDWLDRYIKACRKKKRQNRLSAEEIATLIDRCGAYLGEWIRFNYGGQWENQDSRGGLRFPNGRILFPFTQIEKELENGHNDSIVFLCKALPEMLSGDPTRPSAQLFLEKGLAAEKAGDLAQAQQDFLEAAKLYPAYVQAYYHRARIHTRYGPQSSAESCFTYALKLAPDLIDIYFSRAWTYDQTEDWKLVITDFDAVIQLNPTYRGAYFCRAWAYYRENWLHQAFQDFNKIIELSPNWAEGYYGRGVIYAHRQELEKALEDFNQALALNPDLPNPYHDRAEVHSQLGHAELAIQDFKRYLQMVPNTHQRSDILKKIEELQR